MRLLHVRMSPAPLFSSFLYFIHALNHGWVQSGCLVVYEAQFVTLFHRFLKLFCLQRLLRINNLISLYYPQLATVSRILKQLNGSEFWTSFNILHIDYLWKKNSLNLRIPVQEMVEVTYYNIRITYFVSVACKVGYKARHSEFLWFLWRQLWSCISKAWKLFMQKVPFLQSGPEFSK
jgi:hypothetical protein